MPDFEHIDRELAAIGAVPEAVQSLLDQYGQRDRSLENVDLVLEGLREGREPTSSPPEPERPSFLPLGWDADRKSEPGAMAAPPVALERDEFTTENTGAPVGATPDAELPSEVGAVSGEPPPSEDPHVDTQESSPPPPAEPAADVEPIAAAPSEPQVEPDVPEHRPSRSSRPPRPDLQALLDAELDPREFPSTHPPPRIPRSAPPIAGVSPLPPLPRSSHPPVESEPAAADELELLVDDDDILEIDEDAS